MKTSNIILVSFLVFVFLSPLLIVLAVSSKVGGKDFRVVKNFDYPNQVNLKTGDFSVLRINGNSNSYACAVVKDDSSYIEYENHIPDSIRFTKSGDTLHVYFNPVTPSTDIVYTGFIFIIHTSNPQSIIAEKITVGIFADDYFKENPLQLALNADAHVKFLNHGYARDERFEHTDTVDRRKASFKELTIASNQSALEFPVSLEVGNLTLDCYNGSKLTLPPGMDYQQLSGTISDDTEVHADWQTLKKLKSK